VKAKPTTYNGTRYDSQLEARWAIFLDHHPLISAWTPGKNLGTFRVDDETYTTDFAIKLGVPVFEFLLEAKPSRPSDSYIDKLRIVSKYTKIEIVVGFGSFYQNETPEILTSDDDFQRVIPLAKHLLGAGRVKRAIDLAKSARFDLAQPIQSPNAISKEAFDDLRNKFILFSRGK
jgi:hypothetical protein